jgi:hypothetical protein
LLPKNIETSNSESNSPFLKNIGATPELGLFNKEKSFTEPELNVDTLNVDTENVETLKSNAADNLISLDLPKLDSNQTFFCSNVNKEHVNAELNLASLNVNTEQSGADRISAFHNVGTSNVDRISTLQNTKPETSNGDRNLSLLNTEKTNIDRISTLQNTEPSNLSLLNTETSNFDVRHRRRSPVTVQEWIASLPAPHLLKRQSSAEREREHEQQFDER